MLTHQYRHISLDKEDKKQIKQFFNILIFFLVRQVWQKWPELSTSSHTLRGIRSDGQPYFICFLSTIKRLLASKQDVELGGHGGELWLHFNRRRDWIKESFACALWFTANLHPRFIIKTQSHKQALESVNVFHMRVPIVSTGTFNRVDKIWGQSDPRVSLWARL